MSSSTLTSKGQVTIPKSIREKANLKTGDHVEFFLQRDGSVLLQPGNVTVDAAFGILRRKGRKPIPISEWNERLSAKMAGTGRWKR